MALRTYPYMLTYDDSTITSKVEAAPVVATRFSLLIPLMSLLKLFR